MQSNTVALIGYVFVKSAWGKLMHIARNGNGHILCNRNLVASTQYGSLMGRAMVCDRCLKMLADQDAFEASERSE